MAASDSYMVFLRSLLGTNFGVVASHDDDVSSLKRKAEAQHLVLFPDKGAITAQAVKIMREGIMYHVSDSMPVGCLLDAAKQICFLFMDAVPLLPGPAVEVVAQGLGVLGECAEDKTRQKSRSPYYGRVQSYNERAPPKSEDKVQESSLPSESKSVLVHLNRGALLPENPELQREGMLSCKACSLGHFMEQFACSASDKGKAKHDESNMRRNTGSANLKTLETRQHDVTIHVASPDRIYCGKSKGNPAGIEIRAAKMMKGLGVELEGLTEAERLKRIDAHFAAFEYKGRGVGVQIKAPDKHVPQNHARSSVSGPSGDVVARVRCKPPPEDQTQTVAAGAAASSVASVSAPQANKARKRSRCPQLTAAEKMSDAYVRMPPDFVFKPPPSCHHLLQEKHSFDPWRVLIICMLLNVTTGNQVRKVLEELFTLCPNAETTVKVDVEHIENVICSLGLQHKRAQKIKRFSKEYLSSDWTHVTHLHGIGK